MYPVNQVFLGNPDPLLASDITDQLQRVKSLWISINAITENSFKGAYLGFYW